MTDQQKIDQLTSDKVRLQARLNIYEPLVDKSIQALNRQQALVEGYQKLLEEAHDMIDDVLRLISKSLFLSRISFLLGIIVGIGLLNIAQTILK